MATIIYRCKSKWASILGAFLSCTWKFAANGCQGHCFTLTYVAIWAVYFVIISQKFIYSYFISICLTMQNSDRKTAVDHILHQLFQHGDSAQKYMQGSKSMKIDNFILLDNFVPKSSSSRSRIQALKSHSKRSKKHMSLKQLKKCGSFNLSHEFHKWVHMVLFGLSIAYLTYCLHIFFLYSSARILVIVFHVSFLYY